MISWTVTLSQVCQIFDRGRIPWALFGGAVVALYESTRRIRDLDILTVDSGLCYLADSLGTEIRIDSHNQQLVKIANIEIYGGLRINTNVGVHSFVLDKEMISKCEYMQFALIRVPILSREDHIVLKAILQRGSELGKRDIGDILTLSRAGALDTQYIQHRIESCAAQGRADKLLWNLGVLQPRTKPLRAKQKRLR